MDGVLATQRYELAVCPKEALPELAETVDYYAGEPSFTCLLNICVISKCSLTYLEYERGGHFPALDVPDIFVDDLQKCFKGF